MAAKEFIGLLPDTNRDGARVLGEKLRVAISDLVIPELERNLSASFGIAVLPGDAITGEQLVRAADRALYAAKKSGRNRVETVNESAQRGGEPAQRR
jgi:diguanylate cyclase (GGDEF)-like protein